MTAIALSVRELAFRESDGIQVTPLWHSLTNRLSVLLRDEPTEEPLDVGVCAGYHGIETGVTDPKEVLR